MVSRCRAVNGAQPQCFSVTVHVVILEQCFSNAGPRPGTGPWHQLYRAERRSPGICHFSFLRIFHE